MKKMSRCFSEIPIELGILHVYLLNMVTLITSISSKDWLVLSLKNITTSQT